MSTRDADRIAELEQRNAKLEVELAALRAPRVERIGAMLMPSSAELTKLRRIVLNFRPVLKPRNGDAEHTAEFIACFRYQAQLSRMPDKMSTWSNGTWLDRTQAWSSCSVSLSAFVTALLAHGDIQHTFSADRYPHDLHHNLQEGGFALGDGAGWRRVLNGGTLLPATELMQRPWSCGETRAVGAW